MKISYGYQAPGILVLLFLSAEYSLFFFDIMRPKFCGLLILGYVLLTRAITCNNHGSKVMLPYERELSILLKNLLTLVIVFVFHQCFAAEGIVIENYFDCSEVTCFLLLAGMQSVSIIVFCCACNAANGQVKVEDVIYVYENKKPEFTDEDVAVIHVSELERWIVDGRQENTERFTAGRTHVSKLDVHKVNDESTRESMSGASTWNQDFERVVADYQKIYLYDVSAEKRNELIKRCTQLHKDVYINAKLSDIRLRSSALAVDGDRPIFYSTKAEISRKVAFVKRCADIMFSSLALIVLSPLFLIIMCAIKLGDKGDVFYNQKRVTLDNREFYIIKFRSMIMGAEKYGGPKVAENKDPRITKVGRVLRRLKLDELPQLINILKGDMSFVGPRPERPELIDEIVKNVPEFAYRTSVKAGLTGYAQIHGGYHTDFLEKLKWDLLYIENYSLLLDIKIVLMTIPAVLHGSDDVK